MWTAIDWVELGLLAVIMALIATAAVLFTIIRIEALFARQQMALVAFREQFYQNEMARIAKESEVYTQEMQGVAQEVISLARAVQVVARQRMREEGANTPA